LKQPVPVLIPRGSDRIAFLAYHVNHLSLAVRSNATVIAVCYVFHIQVTVTDSRFLNITRRIIPRIVKIGQDTVGITSGIFRNGFYRVTSRKLTLVLNKPSCTLYDPVDNEGGKDAFKVEFDNDSGKIEQYCHFGVFVNMILSASPVSGVLDNEDWFNDYVCDVYSIDGHVYEHAKILAIGGLWRYTTKNARFSDDIRMMDDIMYSVPDGDKDAVYSLFFDLLGTFYYNWEFALRYAKKLLLGDVEE
jgi:hypothetical protein